MVEIARAQLFGVRYLTWRKREIRFAHAMTNGNGRAEDRVVSPASNPAKLWRAFFPRALACLLRAVHLTVAQCRLLLASRLQLACEVRSPEGHSPRVLSIAGTNNVRDHDLLVHALMFNNMYMHMCMCMSMSMCTYMWVAATSG